MLSSSRKEAGISEVESVEILIFVMGSFLSA